MSTNWHEWGQLGKPTGWAHLHRIAVGKNQDGRLEIFAVGTDGALWQIWQTKPNNGWSHWESRGKPTAEGIALSSPTVGSSLVVKAHQSGRLAVFVVASRSLWYVEQMNPNNGWTQWHALDHPPASAGIVSIEVAQNIDGRLQLFAISYNNRLVSRWQIEPNGDWSEWNTDFPHDEFGFKSFVAGQNMDGRLELITNLSGILALVTQIEPGGPFRRGFGNGGISTSDSIGTLSIARNQDGTLEAAMTIDGRLVHVRQKVPNQEPSSGGGGWAHHDLGRPEEHVAVDLPVLAANRDNHLEVFMQGSDGNLWHRWQTASNGLWSAWHNLGAPSPLSRRRIHVVGQNEDGRLELFVVHRGELWNTWETA